MKGGVKLRELRSLASSFRDGLLGKRDSDMMCAVVSHALSGYLSFIGVKNTVIEGEFMECDHVWIELSNGKILDATLDQFNCCRKHHSVVRRFPKVYIGPPLQFHRHTPPLKVKG